MSRIGAGQRVLPGPVPPDAAAPIPLDEDARLLLACARQDAAAFRRLYLRNGGMLFGIARRITRGDALASDAVHDALLQVWRHAERFDPARGPARAWLVSLVRYRALDLVARTRREVQDDGLSPVQADPAPLALDRLQASADGRRLRGCLEAESPIPRNLVMLAFIEGLTHGEVAVRVQQPLGTVKSTIRRALLRLRDCLGGVGP